MMEERSEGNKIKRVIDTNEGKKGGKGYMEKM